MENVRRLRTLDRLLRAVGCDNDGKKAVDRFAGGKNSCKSFAVRNGIYA